MAKKAANELRASQYYIEMQMSIAQIAKRLDVSEKTLFTWKKEGDWDSKRAKYLKMQYSTNQTLYELLHIVSKKAVDDWHDQGILPDQKTMYFIMNMAGKLKDLKSFETNLAQEKIEEVNALQAEKETPENKENAREEMLQKMFSALLEG